MGGTRTSSSGSSRPAMCATGPSTPSGIGRVYEPYAVCLPGPAGTRGGMAAPTIVALFDRPDQARQAVVALEKRGVDANDITVEEGDLPIPVDRGTRAVDHQTSVEPVRRYFTGGTIGA